MLDNKEDKKRHAKISPQNSHGNVSLTVTMCDMMAHWNGYCKQLYYGIPICLMNSPNHGDIFIFPENLVGCQHFHPIQDSCGDDNPVARIFVDERKFSGQGGYFPGNWQFPDSVEPYGIGIPFERF